MDTYCFYVTALQIPIILLIQVLWYFRTEVLKNYDVSGKNHSGNLPKSLYGVLWKQQKTKQGSLFVKSRVSLLAWENKGKTDIMGQ